MKKYIDMRKKATSNDKKRNYAKRFFKEAEIPARFGKTIYIRKEHHQRIQIIAQTIGENKVSLFSYVDNVLADHFERNRAEIEELYNEHEKAVFLTPKELI